MESMWSRLTETHGDLRDRKASPLDADRVLQASMAAAIELAGTRQAIDLGAQWSPGTPLKLLLAGYSGSRNTGADVRVEEMIRQFRHLFGDDDVELGITTIAPEQTRNYFRTVRQLHIPKIFPRFLFNTVHQYHGVITCEGSMFKSKFASALSTMMAGALGLAVVENKIAVGYGGEAGHMDPSLADLVRKYCRGAYVIARNEASQKILADLGLHTDAGTDTAWTFDPAPPEVGKRLLTRAGWDGTCPVLAICPINPFWWPVKPDLGKAVAHRLTGAHSNAHYDSIYFHHAGDDVTRAQDTYLSAIASAVDRFRETTGCFPILVGMEMLDRRACEALNTKLRRPCPLFISDELDMYEMVSVLHQCSWVVSSRYHALVTSMPGLVPSIGITMDERIRNLMADRGQPQLALEVDDPDLGDRLFTALEDVTKDSEAISEGIGRCVQQNLERMGAMGAMLVQHVQSHHPDFPIAPQLGSSDHPWRHLPALPVHLNRLLESTSR